MMLLIIKDFLKIVLNKCIIFLKFWYVKKIIKINALQTKMYSIIMRIMIERDTR